MASEEIRMPKEVLKAKPTPPTARTTVKRVAEQYRTIDNKEHLQSEREKARGEIDKIV